jgi:hypothetical protein
MEFDYSLKPRRANTFGSFLEKNNMQDKSQGGGGVKEYLKEVNLLFIRMLFKGRGKVSRRQG